VIVLIFKMIVDVLTFAHIGSYSLFFIE